MANDRSDESSRFLARLRDDSRLGVGRGLHRTARFVRGGAGLAQSLMAYSKQGVDSPLSERDLAKLEVLVARLGDLKGLPMKLGQILSYLEIDLPEEARRLLSYLQRQSPGTPFDQVEQTLRADLGELASALLSRMERSPVSIASIGQVHRATLPDGTEVAVKVRHPGMDAAIRSDFRVAGLGTTMAGLVLPGVGVTARDFASELEARLLEECDYQLEAERQRLFGSIFAGHPTILVPAVHNAWCGPRVLTTTWQPGRDFEALSAGADQDERNRFGAALFEFYVGTLYRWGLFHADPHPGNYEFCPDGHVVVFDYGCVRVFDSALVRSFAELADAVRTDSRARMVSALRGLGAEPSTDEATYAHLRQLLRSFFAPMLQSGAHAIDGRIFIDWKQMTRDKLAIARLRLPGRLVFLFRIRFGLYAVLSRLKAVCDWSELERRFAAEPQRALPPEWSRSETRPDEQSV
jgi:predicted unusual protein kinase regulating ubiquinone biosynthesis (AarF/ABC1/UbiB family)